MEKENLIDKPIYIITGIVLIFATFAICVGVGLIDISQNGILFNF